MYSNMNQQVTLAVAKYAQHQKDLLRLYNE